jgi:hypothetical protein
MNACRRTGGRLPDRVLPGNSVEGEMTFKSKIYIVAFVLILLPIVAVPIHRADLVYRLSYADVLYKLIVDHRFGP